MLCAEKINIGLLAHVDAGKTTLAERLLFEGGQLSRAGRVDHQDTFLDTAPTEKRRGITIFSKMAQAGEITYVDTPGHTDFSAEMERTLQILDYAVLIISAPDGLQGHTITLWRLLSQYEVPTFLFINKMDQDGTDGEKILSELRSAFGEGFVAFSDPLTGKTTGGMKPGETKPCGKEPSGQEPRGKELSGKEPSGQEPSGSESPETLQLTPEMQEEIAVLDDALLERYLEEGEITQEDVKDLLVERKLFPCWFGSALKGDGVPRFLQDLKCLLRRPMYPKTFGARVFKITRDDAGHRLTWLKVTGGRLHAKQTIGEEKAEQLMIWSGAGYTQVPEAGPGTVCAVTGLAGTAAGAGLGHEEGQILPALESVLSYEMIMPEEVDVYEAFLRMRVLEEEMPELQLMWESQNRKIFVRVMGPVQIEILTEMIRQRFLLDVSFGAGSIVYRETIEGSAEGVGHYEPLRHYAEVHLLLEEGERGSGLTFSSACPTDELDLNWQRLILTHLEEKQHIGVLTGSPITDLHITLVAGRAHEKHTEGGDFRQAVYRAVRQGLRRAKSVLLEPMYRFRLEVPQGNIGRAMTDLSRMKGTFEREEDRDGMAVFSGNAPVALLQDYPREVISYTGGLGRISLQPSFYAPCHNAEEVIAAKAYDPDADTDNPCGSIFCAHGAGWYVPWDQVEDYMHLDAYRSKEPAGSGAGENAGGNDGRTDESFGWTGRNDRRTGGTTGASGNMSGSGITAGDDELMEIFNRTYGARGGSKSGGWKKTHREWEPSRPSSRSRKEAAGEEYLLVDGYNIIYAWKELAELAKTDLNAARLALADILQNYQGFRGMTLILVFDAYKVEGGTERVLRQGNLYIVFTREKETADAYIERTVNRVSRGNRITVATSDMTEQMIIWGEGAVRMSARDLKEEIRLANAQIHEAYLSGPSKGHTYLFSDVPGPLAEDLEKMRLGEKSEKASEKGSQ